VTADRGGQRLVIAPDTLRQIVEGGLLRPLQAAAAPTEAAEAAAGIYRMGLK
jgi:hypothetical protein